MSIRYLFKLKQTGDNIQLFNITPIDLFGLPTLNGKRGYFKLLYYLTPEV